MPVVSPPVLRFDCTLCRDCCTKYIPLIVSEDVRRIVHHSGLRAEEFVRFYGPDDVDLPASDETWIRTRQGKRVLGLRKMRGGDCYFLKEDGLCRIHEFKPLLCRMYPFQPVNPNARRVRFVFPKSEPCPAERNTRVPLEPLRKTYRAYSDTNWSYVDEVKRWNRETKGRGTTKGFLRFIGLA